MSTLLEIKSQIRDINLQILTDKFDIECYPEKRYNTKFQFWYPKNRLIKNIIKSGAVLTGSRALKCYKVNDRFLLSRVTSDWDFLITKEMAYDICDSNSVSYNLVDKVISVQGQRYWSHPDYSESYRVGPVDIQMIIVDELPSYIEKNNIRIADFSQVLNEKINIIESSTKDEIISKHIEDLKQVIIRYNLSLNGGK